MIYLVMVSFTVFEIPQVSSHSDCIPCQDCLKRVNATMWPRTLGLPESSCLTILQLTSICSQT